MTSYKNSNRIAQCLKSLEALSPEGIYVTDNCSEDGTYEILVKHPKVVTFREKCRRGRGRDIALNAILKVAKPEDCILQVDPDVIYMKAYVNFIKKKMKTIKDNVMYADMGSLSTAKTNIDLHWTPLNASEDTERFAHAIEKGITVHKFRVKNEEEWDKYWDGERLAGGNKKADREARYEVNQIGKYIRWFRHLVDDERGLAIKSFSGFYSMATSKSAFSYSVYLVSYIVAKVKGIYVHDPILDNGEIIRKRAVYTPIS